MNYNNDEFVQRYLDGDLSPAEREEFKRRLSNEPELKDLLSDYTLMQQDLRDLNSAELPDDFWKLRIKPALQQELGIEEKTFLEKLSELFNVKPSVFKPALGGVLFVVAVLGITFGLQNAMLAPESQPYEEAFVRIEALRQEFLAELRILSDEMNDRKDQLVPEVLAAYEKGLEAVNESIAQAERYYTMNADEEQAITRLMAAYDHKAVFLKQFLSLNIYQSGEEQ